MEIVKRGDELPVGTRRKVRTCERPHKLRIALRTTGCLHG